MFLRAPRTVIAAGPLTVAAIGGSGIVLPAQTARPVVYVVPIDGVDVPMRTTAFVNPHAISAGALLALATETIVMTSRGTVGAAMPVAGGGVEPQAANEKSESSLRKVLGATVSAQERIRDLVLQAYAEYEETSVTTE